MTSEIGRRDAPRSRWFGYKHGPDASTSGQCSPMMQEKKLAQEPRPVTRISSLCVQQDDCNAML
jgi:hypothetical protein